LETAFDNMEKYPDYTFTYLQVPAIEPLEELYPEIFYKLRYYSHRKEALGDRIRNPGASGSEGRLAIGSGLWCEIDGCLPCGESLVRHCLYGKRFFEHQFGIDVKTAWFQDAWTHPWTYPQILKKSRIDFDLVIDWQGKNKMVKVAFPLNVKSPQATYEIPYGTIKRPSKGEEHVAQKWVDISENDYGVSLINDSRYGYDVTENVIRLSVLRSPDKPVKATDEAGTHQLKYALYPHTGRWQEANVMQKAYEFNNPLITVVDSVHGGDLSPVHSFIEITPKNLIISVLKKAEDSDDLIVRFYETEGEECTANIVLSEHLPIDAVHKIDLLENAVEDVKSNERGFNAEVGSFSIESFKLIKDFF
jgi:alpha-mannosidase